MPPKKTTATAKASRETVSKSQTATKKKMASASAAADDAKSKPAARTKKANEVVVPLSAVTKKAAAAATAAEKAGSVPATKKTAAATKTSAAAKKPTGKKTKTSEESDKENAAAETKTAKAKAAKRKRADEADEEEPQVNGDAETGTSSDEEQQERAPKRAKVEKAASKPAAPAPKKPSPKKAAAPKPKPARKVAVKKSINEAPTQVMDIFVFGEGSSGELGLGAERYDGKKPIDVKRPRINHNLSGVVQVACGGMHVAVLTNQNKILTWGVNDQGALGRDTAWEGGLRDMDDSDSEDENSTGLNPHESTPKEIDLADVPEDTKWTQVVASDSATFALTDTGDVYGWGTFRSNEGILGFSRRTKIQSRPTLVPELSKVKQLAAGANHVLALDDKGKIFAWGAGQQAQLARRLLDRDDKSALFPGGIGNLPHRAKAYRLKCGSYHSFVLDTKNQVIGWGLNNYAELGIDDEVGTDGGFVLRPQRVDALADMQIVDIAGGEHHSLACTTDGTLLTWGRIDGHQVGQPPEVFNDENTVWDEKQNPRVLLVPTPVAGIKDIIAVAAGTDHSFAITAQGKVYSWGFSANYQTGQGTIEDVERPTIIDNTAIRGRKVVFAGAGGQYSILGALPE